MFVLISSDHGLDTCFDYSKHFTSTHQLCFDSVITTSQGRQRGHNSQQFNNNFLVVVTSYLPMKTVQKPEGT